MPNQLAVNHVLHVSWVAFCRNQLALTSMHYLVYDTLPPAATDQDVADYFDTNFSTSFKNMMSEEAEYLGTTVQIVDPVRRPQVRATAGADTGQRVGIVLPLQVCGLLSKKSNLATKGGRGRMYLPFPSVDDNDVEGKPASTYTATQTIFRNNIDGPITVPDGTASGDAKIQMVLFNQTTKIWTTVATLAIGNKWATQRRRGDYGQANMMPF